MEEKFRAEGTESHFGRGEQKCNSRSPEGEMRLFILGENSVAWDEPYFLSLAMAALTCLISIS